MLRRALIGTFFFATFLLTNSSVSLRPAATGRALPPHVEGEILIKFKPGVTRLSRDRVLVSIGTREASPVGRSATQRVRLTRLDVREAIERYSRHPDVEYVEPNYVISIAAVPNDQNFAAQWHHNNTGQSGGTPGADISSVSAWDVTTAAPNIVTAIVDTGVDLSHPDLAPNVFVNTGEIPNNGVDDDNNGFIDDVSGWDFGDEDNDPTDGNGHGTHVAGIVGAVGNNGIGVAGVVWNTQLLACKFLNSGGTGNVADATECLDYAILMEVDIINASWTGAGSATLREAVERTYDAGILFVAAAGNSGGGNNNDFFPFFPASYEFPNIISVAATNHDDQLWPDSHFGVGTVDIAAPGENILSTWPTGYAFLNGTSMAAPQVAGVAALIKQRVPDIAVETLRQLIFDRSDRLPNLQGVVGTGGRLNAFLPLADQDQIPPARIENLATDLPDATRIDLTWTATGDDGVEGKASRYEVRFDSAPIDDVSFDSATLVPDPPRPANAGESERMRVFGLAPDTTYYFAVKAFDEFNNASPVSNNAIGTTTGPPMVSVTPTTLDEELITGQSTTRTLTLVNDGLGEYTFRVNPERPAAAKRPSPIDEFDSSGGVEIDGPWPAIPREPVLAPWGPPAIVPPDDGTATQLTIAGEDPTGGFSILIVESAADVTEVRNALAAFHDIAVVDVHEGRFDPPSLELLQAYDSVIMVVNNTFEDPLAVGEILADYVDGGGGLVLTLASFINGFEFLGRFLDQGYYPYNLGSGPIAGSTLGAFDPNHAIMEGVETLSGDLLGSVSVAPGANLVASWSNGQPLVATTRGTVVGVNIYIAGAGFWSGDLPLLLRNAAVWSSNVVPWIAVNPETGTVPAGGTLELEVTFDAVGLLGGSYDSDLVFRGDDPLNPQLKVPTHLEVIGAPDLATAPTALDFGEAFIGEPVERTLTARNIGSETLTVTAVSTDHPDFAVPGDGFVLGPGAQRELIVTFTPVVPGAVTATLTLESDDPDEPELQVAMQGRGSTPPDISVSPSNMFDTLVSGDTSIQTLRITNSGGSDLVFTLEREALLAMSAAFQATDAQTPTHEIPPPTLPPRADPNDAELDPANPRGAGPDDGGGADGVAVLSIAGGPFAFSEDFEDGDFDGWTQANSSNFKEVTDTTAAEGTTYSYHQVNQQAGHFNGIFHELPSVTPEYIGFWVRSGSTETNDGYVVLTGAGNFEAIFFFANSEGQFYVNADIGGNTTFEYEAATWYFVEFRDIDFVDRDFDYYVNSELVQENIPFRNPADVLNFHALSLYNFDRDSEAWWDEILVSDDPPAQAIRLDPKRGVVPPGETFEVEVRFDSRGLLAGDHFTNILIESNDPDEPLLVVSTLLNVIGAPDIEFPDGIPDFGNVFVGTTSTLALRLANRGTDTLEVSSASFDDPAFAVEPAAFTLPPSKSLLLTLRFEATALGPNDATLTLISNDLDQSPLALTFHAVGVEPPTIAVDPESIDDQLFTGEIHTHVLTVTNAGGSNLDFDVEIETLGSPAIAAPAISTGHGSSRPAAGSPGEAFELSGLQGEFQAPRADTHLPPDAPAPILGTPGSFSFYDGFEDGDFDGWGDQEGSGLKSVTDLTAANGTRFAYRETNSPGGHLTGIFQVLGGVQSGYVGFWIRSPDRQTADSYVVLRDPDGQVAVFFFANDIGQLYVNADVGGNTLIEYTAGEWIHVEFKDIDFDRQFFDYWIDGELVQDNIPFRNAGAIDSFQQLDIYNFDQGAAGYWDEFLIAAEEPVQKVTITPRGGFVAPGESLELTLRLDASRAVSSVEEFVVHFASNDPVAPDTTVPVRMRVIGAPDIALPDREIDFGLRFTNTTTTVMLDVVNEGPVQLLIDEIAIDNAAFTVEPSSILVGPSSSRQIAVSFSPTTTGSHAGTLVLHSNDPDEGEFLVALSGSAQDPPDIEVIPLSITEQMVSHEMRSRTLTIGNAGATSLNWSIFFDGLQPGWLHVAPRGGSLSAGTAAEVALTFNAGPLQPGLYDTTLRIESNDPDEAEILLPVVMLVAAAPVIRVSPDPLEFEDAFIGETSTATLQVSNLGDAPLVISDITVDNPLFTVATRNLTVAPDTAEAVEVSFTPEMIDPVEATLSITSNDPFQGTVDVTVRGAGETPPDIVVSPSSFSQTMSSFEVLIEQLAITNVAGSELTYEIEVTGVGPVGVEPTGGEAAGAYAAADRDDTPLPAWITPMTTLGPVVRDGSAPIGLAVAEAPDLVKGGGGDTVLFRDGFEDGVFADTWLLQPSESIRTISTTVAADYSTKSFRSSDADGGHLTGIYQELPGLRPGYIGFWVRSTSTLNNDGYVVIRDRNLNEAIFFFLTEVGRAYCNADVGGDATVRYRDDQWMFVEFKNIDFDSQTFDYYVNFQRFSRAVPFRNFGAIEDFARIDLYNFTDRSEAYWDEIVMATENPFDGVRVRPFSGTLEAGLGESVNTIFDTRNLVEGRYEAEIHVRSNDPDEPEIVIPATIDHIGVVILGVIPGEMEFTDVLVGVPKLDRVTVTNHGTARLVASEVTLDHPHFSLSVEAFELAPGTSRSIEVRYDPPGPESIETVMTIRSNDLDDPVVEIPIRASAVIPARLGLDPESIDESLYSGQISTRTLEVSNPGGLDLVFDIDLRTPEGIPIPAESFILADDMETGDGAWTTQVYSQEDLWHRTERAANSGETAWWCGDAATGHYATPYAISTALVSPPIDLRGMEAPIRFSFWENHITEPGFDQCMVDLSLDGGQTWIPLRGAYGSAPSGDSRGWKKRFLILDAYGGNIVHVRFYFETTDATNNAFPGWFVDDVRVTALGSEFVTATPLSASVPNGQTQEILLTFDAFEFRPAGVYEALLKIASNDPFLPFTEVPATLTVTDPGRLSIPGELVTFESVVQTASGTAHSFPVVFPPAGPGTLTVVADGDYDAPDERVTATVESYLAGSVGGSGEACAAIEADFTIPGGTLRRLAADGLVEVTLQDSVEVDSAECATAAQTVRLAYPRTREQLDFGETRIGTAVVRSLEVANVGDGTLSVFSVTSSTADLTIGESGLTIPPQSSATVELTWTPTNAGPIGGTLVIESDDPFGAQTTIGLSGLAQGEPAQADVSPGAIEAALPPHSERTRTKSIRLSNSGEGDLIWSADASGLATLLPESGLVPAGGHVDIAVTLHAAARDEGDYDGIVTIATNDPDNPIIEVAVSLHVQDMPLDMLKLDFTPKYAERPGTLEVYVQVPADYAAADIDLATVDLNGVSPDPSPVLLRDSNRDGLVELVLQFDLEQLEASMPTGETTEVRVGGEVRDKTWFHGSKYVRDRLIVDPPE